MPENRHRLEKLLRGLPGKVPPFLAGWHFTPSLRRRVQERLDALAAEAGTGSFLRQRRVKWPLVGVAGLALAIFFVAWWQWPGRTIEVPAGFRVKPLQYRMVSLNSPQTEALVSIGQVEGSGQLLASISKRREPAGWQLIYTQPLNAYLVLPLEVIPKDNSRGALILITYQERWGLEYHYLILDFDGEKVIPHQGYDKATRPGR